MKDLDPVYDGESGPIRRFPLKDGGSAVSLVSAAVEIYVYDSDDALIARRVGIPVSPKTDGFVDLMFLGREIDWDGAGRELVLRPKIYAATDPNGDPATNVLANPSFDTDAGGDGIADNWALQGVSAATWEVRDDDPFPAVIFGKTQRTFHGALGQTDYIQQGPAITLAVGDVLSVGCWARHTGTAGAAENDNHAIFFRRNAGANSYVRFRVTPRDWYFVTGSLVVDSAQASAVIGIDARGTTLDNRFDDAFMFKGTWRQVPTEALRVQVKPRSRPAKTTNQVAGVGSFEQDSDGDGFADGWSKANASGVTFAHEKAAANVYVGSASQKVTLANFTGKKIELLKRGKFTGTWRAACRIKTNGALGGSPTAGQWGLRLEADAFSDDVLVALGAASDFGLALGAFTQYTNDLVLASEVSALKIAIYLNGATGDVWIDDVQLYRVS